MESPDKRVIDTCTDDISEANQRMQKLSLEGKRAGFALVRHMQDPPKTVYQYCVFYFKE